MARDEGRRAAPPARSPSTGPNCRASTPGAMQGTLHPSDLTSPFLPQARRSPHPKLTTHHLTTHGSTVIVRELAVGLEALQVLRDDAGHGLRAGDAEAVQRAALLDGRLV